MSVAIVTGTRPEIIKMFPIIKFFDTKQIDYTYIHTGQHHDDLLFDKFLEEFGIRKPDFSISIPESDPVDQVPLIMKEVCSVLKNVQPSLVLVEGDTNSVLSSALATLKSRIPLAHIESGLRSNDWRTVEEHNRRVVDHVSDILFSPTETSTKNLRQECVYGRIHTVGNTVIDAIDLCLSKKYQVNDNNPYKTLSPLLGTSSSFYDDFILVTMHRSENVDNPSHLKEVLTALSESKLNYLFPIHPHTHKKIQEYKLTKHIGTRIRIIKPVGYSVFLRLLINCRFVITDSGGVQEEVTSPRINKHALILRDTTERPESVESGHSVLCKIVHSDC